MASMDHLMLQRCDLPVGVRVIGFLNSYFLRDLMTTLLNGGFRPASADVNRELVRAPMDVAETA